MRRAATPPLPAAEPPPPGAPPADGDDDAKLTVARAEEIGMELSEEEGTR